MSGWRKGKARQTIFQFNRHRLVGAFHKESVVMSVSLSL